MCDNRLNQNGASDIIENFCPTLKTIDLSTNEIGHKGIEKLSAYLSINID